MIVDLLVAEALNPTVVRVTEQRHAAIRLGICRNELAHPGEPRPAFLRRGLTLTTPQGIAGQEHPEHEAGVSGRHFEMDAVGGRLSKDLLLHNRATELEPAARRIRALKETSEKYQADAVAQIVIAVQIGLLQVLDDEFAVKKQGTEKAGPKGAVAAGRRVGKEMKAPDPADGAQGDVHGARPIDASRKWIDVNPIRHFGDEFRRIAVVVRQPVGLAHLRKMLAAAQLP